MQVVVVAGWEMEQLCKPVPPTPHRPTCPSPNPEDHHCPCLHPPVQVQVAGGVVVVVGKVEHRTGEGR